MLASWLIKHQIKAYVNTRIDKCCITLQKRFIKDDDCPCAQYKIKTRFQYYFCVCRGFDYLSDHLGYKGNYILSKDRIRNETIRKTKYYRGL